MSDQQVGNDQSSVAGTTTSKDFILDPILNLWYEFGVVISTLGSMALFFFSYLIILATPLKGLFGPGIGSVIGAVGLTIFILWCIGGWTFFLRDERSTANRSRSDKIVEDILRDFELPSLAGARHDKLIRFFFGTKGLTEKWRKETELQKEKVRHSYYTAERVRQRARALGYYLEKPDIGPKVYELLFGEPIDPDEYDSHIQDLY